MDQEEEADEKTEHTVNNEARLPGASTTGDDEPSRGEKLFYEEQESRGTKRPLGEIEQQADVEQFGALPVGIKATWGGADKATATVTFLDADSSFCILGRAAVRCLEGSVDVLGHTVIPDDDGSNEVVVTSPMWSSWIPIQSHHPSTRLQLTSIRGNPTSFRLAPPSRAVMIPPSWTTSVNQIVTDFNSAGAPTKDSLENDASYQHTKQEVLICGAKGVGKSTLLRYLTNRLLCASSDNGRRMRQVAILDADVGQPELSPPGVLRLSLQNVPLLQTPYWNLIHPSQTVASVYFGAITSKVDPTRYIAGVQRLIQAYHEYIAKEPDSIPLLINMDGWVKGLGYQVLTAVINNTQPSHICQLLGETRAQTFELAQSEETSLFFLDACTKYVSQPSILPPVTLRNIRLGAYFAPHVLQLWDAIDTAGVGTLQYGWTDEECILAQYLAHERPYCVPFEAVTCSWSSTDLKEDLQDQDRLLQALNGCIVGLNTANEECLGLGIVRSIDWDKRLFFILTPVDETILPNCTKLAGGHLAMPDPFVFRGIYAESFPYMEMPKTGVTVTALGAAPMKSKHSIGRKSLMMGTQQVDANNRAKNS